MGVNCFICHLNSVPVVADGEWKEGGMGRLVSEIMKDKSMMDLATSLFGLIGNGMLFENMDFSLKP